MTGSRGSAISLILAVDPFCSRTTRGIIQRTLRFPGANGDWPKLLAVFEPLDHEMRFPKREKLR